MTSTNNHARKSTGNGGYKRTLAQAQQVARQNPPRKKVKTHDALPESEDVCDNLESSVLPKSKIEHDVHGLADSPKPKDASNDPSTDEDSDPPKVQKKKPKQQLGSQARRSHTTDGEKQTSTPKTVNVDESLAARDPALLSDLFAQHIKKHCDKMTSLDHSYMNLPSKFFKDTTSFASRHAEEMLPDYLRQFTGKADDLVSCDGEASPHTAIIVSAGMRVADLYRTLLVFNTEDCKVGKLITKHMKLGEMVEYLQQTKVGIIVTTPKRLGDLITEKAVDVDKLRRIVVDGSHKDEKQRTLFDMKDPFIQMVEMMNLKMLKPKLGVGEGLIEIMVF